MKDLSYEHVFDDSENGGWTDGLSQFTDVVSDWLEHMPRVNTEHPLYGRILNSNGKFIMHSMFIARVVDSADELFGDDIFDKHLKWYQNELDEIRKELREEPIASWKSLTI